MKQGNSIRATLQHSVFLPTNTSGKIPTVVAFHGRGADEDDLANLVLALELPNVILITPRAPFPFAYGGYAWYKVGEEGVPELTTFTASLNLLQKFMGEIKSGYPVNSERLMLLGFSQGTAMAYALGLLHPSSFRGIAALSGYIPLRSGLALQLTKLNGFPIFISHGSNDMVIPVRFGREAAETLKHTGADLTYREYSMGHEVSEATVRDLREWVLKSLLRN
jgi:phospholipase/carboxylesterase